MAPQRLVQDRPAPADARRGRDELLLCGVYAHVGVLATVAEAFTRDIQTFFVAHTTADFSQDHDRSALAHAAERCARGTTAKEAFA